MKKLIICLVAILYCQISIGQYSPKNPPPKSYYFSDWSVGLSIKSSFENITTYRALQDSYEFHYQPKFSLELELFVEKRMDNNWFLTIGVNYHKLSMEYDYKIPIHFTNSSTPNSDGKIINEYDLKLNNSFERIEMTALAEYTFFHDGNDYVDQEQLDFRIRSVNRIAYLGIPLSIKKEFGYRKLRFTSKGGLELAALINSKIDYDYYHQSGMYIEGDRENYKYRGEESVRVELKELNIENQLSYLQLFQLNGFISIGFVHSHKYHTFFMDCEYKRSLTSFSQKNKTSYLQSIGLRSGFIKRFAGSRLIDRSRRQPKFNW